MSGAAPRPAPGLTVAIVGHRPDRIQDSVQVKDSLTKILRLAAEVLGNPAPGSGRLRLVSALAEGADRLAAAAALEADVALDAVLPFSAEEYKRDFHQAASREEFHDLLRQAESVLVLDGAAGVRDQAYEAAGKALLDNCDLLMAVWDGQLGRGRGGTREVVEDAVRRGIPVVTVSPDGRAAGLRLQQGGGRARLEDVSEAPYAELPAVLESLLLGPSPGGVAAGELPSPGWIYATYPLLLKLLGVGRKKRAKAASPLDDEPPASPLHQAFLWWDAAAICAAQAFRSAVIVNFALAALAVMLAASSLIAGGAKWLFVVAEVATILLLLGNTWYAGRARWQERWLESRELAEMLRVCLMLRDVGIGRGMANSRGRGWTSSYALAMARSSRLATVDLSDPEAAAKQLVSEIAGQAAWNEATAKKMHQAGHRLGRIGEALFGLVLAAAIGWLILLLVDADAAERLKYALTAVTAGLPAVATASYGIRIILDFEGVATRASRMASALRAVLSDWQASPPSSASLQDFARRAAEVMLGDVAAWRLLAEGRRLAIPG
jgi:hypothetical protein